MVVGLGNSSWRGQGGKGCGNCAWKKSPLNAKVSVQPEETFDLRSHALEPSSASCLLALLNQDLLGPFSIECCIQYKCTSWLTMFSRCGPVSFSSLSPGHTHALLLASQTAVPCPTEIPPVSPLDWGNNIALTQTLFGPESFCYCR